MLRVQTQELDGALICRLEGRFTGKGAEEARTLVTRCDSKLELVVDLTDVMFIDAIGEEVLLFVKRLGSAVRCRDFIFAGRLRTASASVGKRAKT